MTDRTRRLYRGAAVRRALVAVLFAGLFVSVGAFVLDAGSAEPEPVPYGDTVSLGLPDEDRFALRERGLSVPRVQVFYSGYTYVVGYDGVERAVEALSEPEHTQQFGAPLSIHVSDYAGTDVELTDDGLLDPAGDPGWVRADDAWYVLGSEARTTVGGTVVPFSVEGDATAFADRYGGDVVDWSTVESTAFAFDDGAAVRGNVPDLHAHADERVAAARPLLDREVSVVVGEDEPTVQAAIEAAPANSTVVVPGGVYEEHVEVDRPVTLRGENATVRGNESGTVLTVTADDVAITGLAVTGVGNQTRPDEADRYDTDRDDEWDDAVDTGYGHSDAGIGVIGASGVYVADVHVDTQTSGVLYRDSPGGVVEGLTVTGNDDQWEGFMGVLSVRSPVVVQDSLLEAGRDGVYLHRAPGSVVRDSTFLDNRFGVHLMFTSGSLLADNVARGQTSAGMTIMTTSARNAVVGNDVRNASAGIIPSGSRSYLGGNVLAHNGMGMTTGTSQSLYERNVLYGNDVGLRAGSTFPSNELSGNDFVDNEVPVTTGTIGPLQVWAGNYWDGAYGDATGDSLDGSYSPTDPVEGRLHRTDGTVTLAESPAAMALAEVRSTSPGLRQGNVVDVAPLAEPVRPDVIEALSGNSTGETLSVTGGEHGDG